MIKEQKISLATAKAKNKTISFKIWETHWDRHGSCKYKSTVQKTDQFTLKWRRFLLLQKLKNNFKNIQTKKWQKSTIYLHKVRVKLNRLGFLIHNLVLDFHHWILCYHESFQDKIKRWKSLRLSMDLWNLKFILTLWTLTYVDCVPFFLYWFFPHYSQLSQLI